MDIFFFFFSSRRRHTRWTGDWSSDVCSSDLPLVAGEFEIPVAGFLCRRESDLERFFSLLSNRLLVYPNAAVVQREQHEIASEIPGVGLADDRQRLCTDGSDARR